MLTSTHVSERGWGERFCFPLSSILSHLLACGALASLLLRATALNGRETAASFASAPLHIVHTTIGGGFLAIPAATAPCGICRLSSLAILVFGYICLGCICADIKSRTDFFEGSHVGHRSKFIIAICGSSDLCYQGACS